MIATDGRESRNNGTQVLASSNHQNLLVESQEIGTDVQHKISLRYDKIELEQKLAEMAQTINNFKSAYGGNAQTESVVTTVRSSTNNMTGVVDLKENSGSRRAR